MSEKTPLRSRQLLVTFLFIVLAGISAFAQGSANNSAALTPAEVSRIVTAFTTKEGQFRHALNQYSFKRDAILQSLGMGGQVTGEYHRGLLLHVR